MKSRLQAFTLIELLVVIAIIGILASLLLPCLSKAKNRARMIEEASAGRQLMYGVQMFADDNNDAIFPGYVTDPGAVDDQGQALMFPENARYPWRIYPYIAKSMNLIYSGDNRAKLDQLRSQSRAEYVYGVSVFPSLGINSYFIGGNESLFPAATANTKFGAGTVLLKMAEAKKPSDLIIFMSARSAVSGNNAQGYYHVTPPYLKVRQWAATYSAGSPPEEWGFVAPRFNNRTVAAMLDGHAQTLNMQEMQNMQRWCNNANKPDWVLSP